MPAPDHSIFTARMLFLRPNQQCQSTEGTLFVQLTLLVYLQTDAKVVEAEWKYLDVNEH